MQVHSVSERQRPDLENEKISRGSFVHSDLSIREDRTEIVDRKGTTIALLSDRDHQRFRHTHSSQEISYEALIDREKLFGMLQKKLSSSRRHNILKADLLVMGASEDADAIGRKLAEYHLFLQHPHPFVTQLEYQNPQYLRISGEAPTMGILLPPIQAESREEEEASRLKGSSGDHVDEAFDLWHALDIYSKQTGLRESSEDDRILTKLRRSDFTQKDPSRTLSG